MKLSTYICAFLLALLHGASVIAADKASCKTIAFTTEYEGELQLLHSASGEIRKLNVGRVSAGNLAYSSTRDLLAFDEAEGLGRSGSLYLLDLKTLKVERIYSGKPSLYRPQFDPEGSCLYAFSYFDGIYKYCLASRAWEKISISGIDSLNFNPGVPSFSKSGRRVAMPLTGFIGKVPVSRGAPTGFYIARVENGRFTVVDTVATDFLDCGSPQWIGDEKIVFAGRKEEGLQYIWKLDLTFGTLDQITRRPIGTRDFLSLSRDEKAIVFTGADSDKQIEWKLWQVSTDGTGLKQLTGGDPDIGHLSPVWIE